MLRPLAQVFTDLSRWEAEEDWDRGILHPTNKSGKLCGGSRLLRDQIMYSSCIHSVIYQYSVYHK